MHVPWGWIKQRPHFIAEGLSDKYSVDVLSKKSYNKHCDNDSLVNLINIPRLPFERYRLIRNLNKSIQRLYIKKIISKYDIIWSTCPNDITVDALSYLKPHQSLIYDCMDDVLEFSEDENFKKKIYVDENNIYQKSNIIFCSSSYLKNKIQKRYGVRDIKIVNNALASYSISEKENSKPFFVESSNKKIVYIGTVSEWINFDLVNRLAQIPFVDFYFIGPYKEESKRLAQSSNIHFTGAVEHNKVNQIMAQSDILIMPFIVNELILSVNPVKLYEYIASGKPCFAPKYGESLQFEEYCYLYENDEECYNMIKDLLTNNGIAKKSHVECIEFAKKNTWEHRIIEIKKSLSFLEKK